MAGSLINKADFVQLERERDAIKKTIEPQLQRLSAIEKRIELASQLRAIEAQDQSSQVTNLESKPSPGLTPSAQNATSNGSSTLVDAVPLVLKEHGPLKPAEIRARLGDVGFLQPYNDNYFYTVISRLHKAGAFVRLPDKRLALPPDSSTAKSGAMH